MLLRHGVAPSVIDFERALALLLLTTGISVAARWIPWPRPIVYALGGAAFAFVPGFPRVALDPGFFFLCFLPPLLFSDGWLMPLREFFKARRSIGLLATGLVVFTTVAVGLTAHALVPGLPLSLAFALGAIVSPTDAVAVGAITERLKVPGRLTIVLEGESLMNDATGLVAFKFALAAFLAGTFSLRAAAMEFVVVSAGGLAAGFVVGYAFGKLRDVIIRAHGADPLIEITLSLLTPYAAFIAAEAAGLSSVLAVVVAGLYSGWRDPVRMDAETRQTARGVWSMLLFWLNGLAFVLLGLQFPRLLAAVRGTYSLERLVGTILVISLVAVVARITWFFPGAYLPFLVSKRVRATESMPSWQAVLVGGWAGMRGTVTLAAALSLPLALPDGGAFPFRDLIIFLAFGIVATTLLVQGTTLEWLIRRLGLREDGIRQTEEKLARTAAVDSGLRMLRIAGEGKLSPEESAALGHVVAEYEQRLSALGSEGETRTHARERRTAEHRFRKAALDAERRTLDELWRNDVIADDVYRPLQQLLDFEESMLRSAGNAAA